MSVETSRGILDNPAIRDRLDPSFRDHYDNRMMEELLIPNPIEKAIELLGRIKDNDIATVSLIYSLSMYSGKTTAAVELLELIKREKEIFAEAVQPKFTRFEGQEHKIMTHQKVKPQSYKAILTDTSLYSVLEIAEELKSKSEGKKAVLVIDEGMFFIDHNDNPDEAVEIIEHIRSMGIHVVITGITLNFKQRPFTVMDYLVRSAENIDSWFIDEMSTQCAFGPERARATARYFINGEQADLAKLTDPDVLPGSEERYLQVCGDKHPSFSK